MRLGRLLSVGEVEEPALGPIGCPEPAPPASEVTTNDEQSEVLAVAPISR
jgi:hypothetical protein